MAGTERDFVRAVSASPAAAYSTGLICGGWIVT